jgi:hypothetical protein
VIHTDHATLPKLRRRGNSEAEVRATRTACTCSDFDMGLEASVCKLYSGC